MRAHSVGQVHTPLTWPALLLLFAISLGGTMLIAWPDRPPATRATSSMVAERAPTTAGTPAPSVAAPGTILQQESAAAEIPPHLFAMYAEPALFDLLEDAGSPDPQVREEALRVLRDHQMLPQEQGASTSVQFPSRH